MERRRYGGKHCHDGDGVLEISRSDHDLGDKFYSV